MNTGIISVAFGIEYDKCAAHTFLYSRKFTDLPFFILTNIKEKDRHKTWKSVSNVTFMEFDKTQRENRKAKLRMNEFTPFDRTLYIDCDSVIQMRGVDNFGVLLDDSDMVFNWRIEFRPGQKIWNIYARCMKQFNVSKPISIYNGGIVAFKNNENVDKFFKTWYSMWEQFGKGREMPPLNCAIKKTGIKINKFPLLYFADNAKHENCLIQHNYNGTFCQTFGIPKWIDYKPFDGGNDDFRFERIPT